MVNLMHASYSNSVVSNLSESLTSIAAWGRRTVNSVVNYCKYTPASSSSFSLCKLYNMSVSIVPYAIVSAPIVAIFAENHFRESRLEKELKQLQRDNNYALKEASKKFELGEYSQAIQLCDSSISKSIDLSEKHMEYEPGPFITPTNEWKLLLCTLASIAVAPYIGAAYSFTAILSGLFLHMYSHYHIRPDSELWFGTLERESYQPLVELRQRVRNEQLAMAAAAEKDE